MTNTDPHSLGAELNQLARLLFDAAARKWYLAAVLEAGAGIFMGVLSLIDLPSNLALVGALIGILLLASAYVLRLRFEEQQETAETMRRQAAFTEGLGWSVSQTQHREWLRRAGRRLRRQVEDTPREPDYYATKEPLGARRLAEMTAESAFWTRNLYCKLRTLIWWCFGISTAIFMLVTLITLTRLFPDTATQLIARALYSFIPVVISANFLGWALQLNRLISNLEKIESDFEEVQQSSHLDEPQVLRLIAEYNCQTAIGFPIHNWLFRRWHDEIAELWKK